MYQPNEEQRTGPFARILSGLLLVLWTAAISAQAVGGAPLDGAALDGAALYAPCTACHGVDGAGNSALGAPAIAGQLESYLERQLDLFRAGLRGTHADDRYGAQMQPFAQQLADEAAVSAVVAYIAALPPVPGQSVGAGDARRGSSLYNGNCGACHGGSAEGNDALKAPRLAGLDRDYLNRQLRHFREGVRGAHPDDRLGRQMALMANTLSADADIDAVFAHIETLAAGNAP